MIPIYYEYEIREIQDLIETAFLSHYQNIVVIVGIGLPVISQIPTPM